MMFWYTPAPKPRKPLRDASGNEVPLAVGDRVQYVGAGTSVPKGSRGTVKGMYRDQVEVLFDCGTLLTTSPENLELGSPGSYYNGFYAT